MIRNKFIQDKKSIREHYHKATPNFVGVGLGDAAEANHSSENCVKVYVSTLTKEHKNGKHKFSDGSSAELKYVEVGKISFTGFTGRYRPAQPGAVIGSAGAPYDGTFGALVTDNTDGSKVILSCNHVLANYNALPIGTAVLQPGPNHGGDTTTDVIGNLKRFVPIDLQDGGINYVDVAIASRINTNIANGTPFCSSVKPNKQGAVGLMWAASPYITILSPIASVVSLMNVTLPKTRNATVGMSIHACTAASGYVATTVYDTLVDLAFDTEFGTAWFLDQITCVGGIADGAGGDSGSMFYTTFNV